MSIVTIDNQQYDSETLSEEAKSQLQMMVATDQELARLNVQVAIAQTARAAYAAALKASLPTPLEQLQAQGDTLQLD
jgi:Family of unknown function (DUF6447)